jgi:hypothetical protein
MKEDPLQTWNMQSCETWTANLGSGLVTLDGGFFHTFSFLCLPDVERWTGKLAAESGETSTGLDSGETGGANV